MLQLRGYEIGWTDCATALYLRQIITVAMMFRTMHRTM